MSESRCTNESCPHTQDAADRAVERVFAIFGVDVNVPKEVEAFREGIRFGGKIQKAAGRFWLVVVSLLATGITLSLWDGLRIKLGL